MQGTDISTASDEELAKRIHGKDERAFEVLHARYARLLFHRAFALLRPDHQQAEGATNDAWRIAWTELSKGNFPHTNMRAWLCTITRNHALALRKQASRRSTVPLNSDGPTAADNAVGADLREAVEHCISKLDNARVQSLVRLRLLEGVERGEACPQVGYNDLNHCSTVYRKAVESLERCLSDEL